MKYLLLLIFSTIYLCAGNLWSLLKNSDLPKVNTTAYQIEVKGVNIRGYTFIPKNTKDIKCVIVFTENNMQLSCFKNKTK